jgi:hypothetical protein
VHEVFFCDSKFISNETILILIPVHQADLCIIAAAAKKTESHFLQHQIGTSLDSDTTEKFYKVISSAFVSRLKM